MKKNPLFSNRKGQSAVEFSLVFTAFMILMFAVGGLTTIGYNWMVLQYAASEASRFGSLGQQDPGLTREESIVNRAQAIAAGLRIADVNVTLTDEDDGATAGNGSEYFRLTLTRNLEMPEILGVFFTLTGGGEVPPAYQVTARTVIRNEPF